MDEGLGWYINLSKSNNYIDQTKKCKFYNRVSICPDFNNTEIGKDSLSRKGGYDGVIIYLKTKHINIIRM